MFRVNPYLLYNSLSGSPINLTTATLKAKLVMTNTTCDSEIVATVAGFTTLDQCDGAGYADLTLSGVALSTPDAGDGSFSLDAVNLNFPTLGPGTRQSQGVLIYDSVSDVWICYQDFSTPKTHDTDDWPLNFHVSDGLAKFTVPTA